MKKFVFLTSLLLISGCSLDGSLMPHFDECPGEGGIGSLAYIEDREKCNPSNAASCNFEKGNLDYTHYFEHNVCPQDFPRCVTENTDNGVEYHCERSAKFVCVGEGTFTCGEEADDTLVCIDPSTDEFCGADSCDATNHYGGTRCTGGARCKLDENDKYTCRCGNNELRCDNQCINPSSEYTCGAKDCNLEKYGGDDCSQYGDSRICVKGDDHQYRCQCRPEDVLCNGQCVMPANSDNFCGAKGACNSTDSSSDDFMGVDCAAGGARCNGGTCVCPSGSIWCIPEGSDQGACINPFQNDTCNAQAHPDTKACIVTQCDANQVCTMRSFGEYYCQTSSCQETEQICLVNGEYQCVPKFDLQTCGSCDRNCSNHNYSNVEVEGCAINPNADNKIQCMYQCTDGLNNCGTPFDPMCINTQENIQHCGRCQNACKSDQKCQDGTCIDTGCAENTCAVDDGAGGKTCINTNDKCGASCTPCQNLHTNAYCAAGTCAITSCLSGEHPEYNANGHIIKCHKNTVNACAPSDSKIHDTIHDCIAEKDPNAESVTCDNGTCIITTCKPNYHLSLDKKSCIQNTETACATQNSSSTQNCTSISNAASTKCDNGICRVLQCHTNYHLNSNHSGCEPTTESACAPTNSSTTSNCNDISNTAGITCDNGTCKVTACATNYHPNSSFNGCIQNTNASCASTTSSSAQNCNNISNAASTKCDNGTCKVTACNTNYHPNSGFTGCNANSQTSCASTTSASTQNCNNISNAASTKCDNGTCKVTACNTNYHPNSGYTGCSQNTNTACGSTTSSSTKNCTAGVEPYCVNGSCECSTDGSEVVNYDETTCVHERCEDVYGVTESTASSSRCIASGCSDGFINNHDSGWGVCLLISNTLSTCSSQIPGWKNGKISGSKCYATSCKSGYTLHHAACIPDSAFD